MSKSKMALLLLLWPGMLGMGVSFGSIFYCLYMPQLIQHIDYIFVLATSGIGWMLFTILCGIVGTKIR